MNVAFTRTRLSGKASSDDGLNPAPSMPSSLARYSPLNRNHRGNSGVTWSEKRQPVAAGAAEGWPAATVCAGKSVEDRTMRHKLTDSIPIRSFNWSSFCFGLRTQPAVARGGHFLEIRTCVRAYVTVITRLVRLSEAGDEGRLSEWLVTAMSYYCKLPTILLEASVLPRKQIRILSLRTSRTSNFCPQVSVHAKCQSVSPPWERRGKGWFDQLPF